MRAVLVDRPGNAAISEEDRARLSVLESFDGLDVKSAEAGNSAKPTKAETGDAAEPTAANGADA